MRASRGSGEGVCACSGTVQNSWPGVRVPFTHRAFVYKSISYADENIIIISVNFVAIFVQFFRLCSLNRNARYTVLTC